MTPVTRVTRWWSGDQQLTDKTVMTGIMNIWLYQNIVLVLLMVRVMRTRMLDMETISLVFSVIVEPPGKTVVMYQRRRFRRIKLR